MFPSVATTIYLCRTHHSAHLNFSVNRSSTFLPRCFTRKAVQQLKGNYLSISWKSFNVKHMREVLSFTCSSLTTDFFKMATLKQWNYRGQYFCKRWEKPFSDNFKLLGRFFSDPLKTISPLVRV